MHKTERVAIGKAANVNVYGLGWGDGRRKSTTFGVFGVGFSVAPW